MFRINPQVDTNQEYSKNVEISGNSILLKYPICPNSYECAPYKFSFPPGKFHIECYGASGGRESGEATTFFDPYTKQCLSQTIVEAYKGNTQCANENSPGAGGYIAGILTIKKRTNAFAYIGGKGTYGTTINKGGYNGGGSANINYASASGGGATDLRIEENDVYHRVIVAGGGGGTDNTKENDGRGGSGGYPEGQGYWVDNSYHSNPLASQLYGFSFGIGESAGPKTNHPNSTSSSHTDDIAGARGGWFGGFISGNINGGGGGGSSFILTKTAQIPLGIIKQYDSRYNEILSQGEYAFDHNSQYVMTNMQFANGIWAGNGQIRITVLSIYILTCKTQIFRNFFLFTLILIP